MQRHRRSTAIALAGGALAILFAAEPAWSAGKISKDVAVPLSAAQKAAQAGNWQEALTQARAAQAVASRTPFDDVEINDFIGIASINLKDMRTATTAFEAAADSPANTDMDPADRAALYHNALLLAADAQHWQRVITYGQVLEGLNKMDDITDVEVAVAYYNLKDTARAQQYAQKSIDAAKAAGKPPQDNALKIVMNAQAGSNPAAAEQTLEQIVIRSNSPEDWAKLIGVAFGAKGMNDILAMDLYRLQFVAHALSGNDAGLAGRLAIQLRFYGDAVAILEGAGVKGADLNSARAQAAREQGSIGAEIAAAHKGNGQTALSVAEGLYGYGRFADAEQLAREAVTKGKTKTPGEAQLLVGMSLVRQGKLAEAQQAFQAVTGSPAALKTAHLWQVYIQAKGGAAAAATPPAH